MFVVADFGCVGVLRQTQVVNFLRTVQLNMPTLLVSSDCLIVLPDSQNQWLAVNFDSVLLSAVIMLLNYQG